MGKTIRGISVEIGGTTTKLKTALEDVNKNARSLNTELTQVNKLLAVDPKNTEALSQKQEILNNAISNTKDKLIALKDVQSQIQNQYKSGAIGDAEYRAFNLELAKTEQNLKSLEKQTSVINNIDFSGLSTKIKNVGSFFTKYITTPILGVISVSTKLASDFETSMAKISTIADTTKVPINSLKEEILALSEETGVATSELANSVYEGISAGVDTSKIIDVVRISTQSAKAGFTDTATAIDGLTTVLNSYNLSMDYAGQLSNEFLIAQNLGKTTFGELATSIGKVSPIASNLNISTQELLSSIASLTANGIETSEAVTGLKASFSNILKPTADATEEAKRLNLEFNATALQSKGLAGFLKEVMNATDGNIDSLSKLFGSTEAVNTMLSLTSEKGLQIFNDGLSQMATNTTATEDAFNKMNNTTGVKFAQTLAKLKSQAISLGEEVLPYVNKFLESTSSLIEKFGTLDDGTKQLIVTSSLLIAPLGLIVSGVGSLVGIIGSLGFLLSPTGLVIAGIGMLLTLGLQLANTINDANTRVIELTDSFNSIETVTQKATASFDEMEKATKEKMKSIGDEFRDTISQIENSVTDNEITSAYDQLLSNFETVFSTKKQGIVDQWGQLRTDIANETSLTKEDRAKMIDEINAKEKEQLDVLEQQWADTQKSIKDITQGDFNDLKDLTGDEIVKINDLFNNFSGIKIDLSETKDDLKTQLDDINKQFSTIFADGNASSIPKEDIEEFKQNIIDQYSAVATDIDSAIETQVKLKKFNLISDEQYKSTMSELTKYKDEINTKLDDFEIDFTKAFKTSKKGDNATASEYLDMTSFFENLQYNIDSNLNNIGSKFYEQGSDNYKKYTEGFTKSAEETTSVVEETLTSEIPKLEGVLTDEYGKVIDQSKIKIGTKAKDFGGQIYEYTKQGWTLSAENFDPNESYFNSYWDKLPKDAKVIGGNIAGQINTGFDDAVSLPDWYSKGYSAGSSYDKGFKSALEIKSPSRKAKANAKNTFKGFALGSPNSDFSKLGFDNASAYENAFNDVSLKSSSLVGTSENNPSIGTTSIVNKNLKLDVNVTAQSLNDGEVEKLTNKINEKLGKRL